MVLLAGKKVPGARMNRRNFFKLLAGGVAAAVSVKILGQEAPPKQIGFGWVRYNFKFTSTPAPVRAELSIKDWRSYPLRKNIWFNQRGERCERMEVLKEGRWVHSGRLAPDDWQEACWKQRA